MTNMGEMGIAVTDLFTASYKIIDDYELTSVDKRILLNAVQRVSDWYHAKKDDEIESCSNCKFCGLSLQCRRHSPVYVTGSSNPVFPEVSPRSWCGDYERA